MQKRCFGKVKCAVYKRINNFANSFYLIAKTKKGIEHYAFSSVNNFVKNLFSFT